jgi:hypothetical protein
MEYDIVDSWTAYAALGRSMHEIGLYSAPKLIDRAATPRRGAWIPTAYRPISGMAGYAANSIPVLFRTRSTSAIRRNPERQNRVADVEGGG